VAITKAFLDSTKDDNPMVVSSAVVVEEEDSRVELLVDIEGCEAAAVLVLDYRGKEVDIE
jgi:hypothetical protein